MKNIALTALLLISLHTYGQYVNGEPIPKDTVEIYQVGPCKHGSCYTVNYGQYKKWYKSYLLTDAKGNRLKFKNHKQALACVGGKVIKTYHIETEIGRKIVYVVKK